MLTPHVLLGPYQVRLRGREVHDAHELRHVDVLGGEAAAQHVVGVGHDLDADAAEVGVGDSGAEVEGLAGEQVDVVEQEGGGDAGIAGAGAGDVAVHGQVGVAVQVEQGLLDLGAQRPVGLVEHLGEHLPQAARSEQVGPGAKVRQGQTVEEVRGGGGVAEAAQAVERGERADHLGLVRGVLVRARRVVDGDAPGVLVGEPGLGLRGGGVDLEGERTFDGQDLEQVGERGAEAGGGGLAEGGGGVVGDELVQRDAGDGGGVAGVGAHPELGLGPAGGLGPEQVGERRDRAPVVGPDGGGQAHGRGGRREVGLWHGGGSNRRDGA
ncbi:hypothetical protein GCM10020216_037510 [Nonomuraea helvata]